MSGTADIAAIRLAPEDNVATALRDIASGEVVAVRCGDRIASFTAAEPVPSCHKISLAVIPSGANVMKYGQPIGHALEGIAEGRHVHVHNMRSARARSEA